MTAALVVAATAALVALAFWIRWLLQGPYVWDSSVYWAMGRGVLNGVVPYRDLFDFKPPGIFLISALGLSLGRGLVASAPIDALVLALIVVTPTTAVWIRSRAMATTDRLFSTCSTFCFTALLGADLFSKCGGFQTECFGSLFGVLYAAVLFHGTGHKRAAPLWATTPLILAAVGTKEPYAAVLAAVALVSLDPRQLVRNFLLPAAIAAIGGFLILSILGWWEPLVSIYVPSILAVVDAGIAGSQSGLFSRATELPVLRSVAPFLLPLAIALAACVVFILDCSRRRGRQALFLTALAFGCAGALTTLAMASAPHLGRHHLVMPVPLFVAIVLRAIREGADRPGGFSGNAFGTLFAVFVIVSVLRFPPAKAPSGIAELRRWEAPSLAAARAVDAVVAGRPGTTWAYLGGWSRPIVPAFTKSSPDGRIFFQLPHFLDNDSWIKKQLIDDVKNVDLVVMDRSIFSDRYYRAAFGPLQEILQQEFSVTPWNGSAPPAPEPFVFYYRKRPPDVIH